MIRCMCAIIRPFLFRWLELEPCKDEKVLVVAGL